MSIEDFSDVGGEGLFHRHPAFYCQKPPCRKRSSGHYDRARADGQDAHGLCQLDERPEVMSSLNTLPVSLARWSMWEADTVIAAS